MTGSARHLCRDQKQPAHAPSVGSAGGGVEYSFTGRVS